MNWLWWSAQGWALDPFQPVQDTYNRRTWCEWLWPLHIFYFNFICKAERQRWRAFIYWFTSQKPAVTEIGQMKAGEEHSVQVSHMGSRGQHVWASPAALQGAHEQEALLRVELEFENGMYEYGCQPLNTCAKCLSMLPDSTGSYLSSFVVLWVGHWTG